MGNQSKSTHGKHKETQKSSREIESEIDETRSAITEDINALSEKFSPEHLKQEAKEAVVDAKNAVADKAVEMKDVVADKAVEMKDVVADKALEVKDAMVDKAVEIKDATTEKAAELKNQATETLTHARDAAAETLEQVSEQAQEIGSATWQFTRANAVPIALIGLGAGWMIANSRRTSRSENYEFEVEVESPRSMSELDEFEYGEPLDYGTDYGRTPGTQGIVSTRSGITSQGSARRRTSSGRKPSAMRNREPSRSWTNEASDRARRVEKKLANGASQGTDLLRKGWNRARETTSRGWDRARESATSIATEKPLVATLGVLAAGIGIGLLLPTNDRETKLLQPVRTKIDRVLGDARQAASDVAQVAKDTANDSMRAIS